jgi:hypothetical protein
MSNLADFSEDYPDNISEKIEELIDQILHSPQSPCGKQGCKGVEDCSAWARNYDKRDSACPPGKKFLWPQLRPYLNDLIIHHPMGAFIGSVEVHQALPPLVKHLKKKY